MSELCRRFRASLPIYLTLLLLLVTASSVATAQGAKLLSMDWHGPNLVLRFSDSVSFHTDMVESDSNLTIRFAVPIDSGRVNRRANGDLIATLDEDGSTFRLVGDRRVGYSMLWGPWSHTLVIYTFDWDSLTFAEEQFHLGLIALEQDLPNISTEYLSTAHGADTGLVSRRSGALLGMVYARSGEDSLASIYLTDPRDVDGWGARSEVLRRTGDTAAAATAERQMADVSDVVPGLADADYVSAPSDEIANANGAKDFLTGWQGITLLVIAGMLILFIATMFARRPPKSDVDEDEHRKGPEESKVRVESHHPVTPLPVQHQSPLEADVEISTPPPDPEEAERIIAEEVPKLRGSSMEEIFSPHAKVESPEAPDRPTTSRQADALRRRVKGETAESGTASKSVDSSESDSEAESERESTISSARRMNVSRDYVELRKRLARMRKD